MSKHYPLPDVANPGEQWTIIDSRDPDTGWCRGKARQISVPLGATIQEAYVRAHELAHTKHTPRNLTPETAARKAGVCEGTVQVAEDARCQFLSQDLDGLRLFRTPQVVIDAWAENIRTASVPPRAVAEYLVSRLFTGTSQELFDAFTNAAADSSQREAYEIAVQCAAATRNGIVKRGQRIKLKDAVEIASVLDRLLGSIERKPEPQPPLVDGGDTPDDSQTGDKSEDPGDQGDGQTGDSETSDSLGGDTGLGDDDTDTESGSEQGQGGESGSDEQGDDADEGQTGSGTAADSDEQGDETEGGQGTGSDSGDESGDDSDGEQAGQSGGNQTGADGESGDDGTGDSAAGTGNGSDSDSEATGDSDGEAGNEPGSGHTADGEAETIHGQTGKVAADKPRKQVDSVDVDLDDLLEERALNRDAARGGEDYAEGDGSGPDEWQDEVGGQGRDAKRAIAEAERAALREALRQANEAATLTSKSKQSANLSQARGILKRRFFGFDPLTGREVPANDPEHAFSISRRIKVANAAKGTDYTDARHGFRTESWATPIIERIDLPNKAKGVWKRASRSVSDTGVQLTAIQRLCVDQRVFKGERKNTGRPTILFDLSGSMSLTSEQVATIVRKIPFCTIATYSGNGGRGVIRIIAEGGRYNDSYEACCSPAGGNNLIDGDALRWLEKQSGPRVWVSDGGVTVAGSAQRPWDEKYVAHLPSAWRDLYDQNVENAKRWGAGYDFGRYWREVEAHIECHRTCVRAGIKQIGRVQYVEAYLNELTRRNKFYLPESKALLAEYRKAAQKSGAPVSSRYSTGIDRSVEHP